MPGRCRLRGRLGRAGSQPGLCSGGSGLSGSPRVLGGGGHGLEVEGRLAAGQSVGVEALLEAGEADLEAIQDELRVQVLLLLLQDDLEER